MTAPEHNGIGIYTTYAGTDDNDKTMKHVIVQIMRMNHSVFLQFRDDRFHLHGDGLFTISNGVFWEESPETVKRLLRHAKRLWTMQETGKLDEINQHFKRTADRPKRDCFRGAIGLLRAARARCPLLPGMYDLADEFALDNALRPFSNARSWHWQSTGHANVWVYAPEYARLVEQAANDLTEVLGVPLEPLGRGLIRDALNRDVEEWRNARTIGAPALFD